MPSTRKQKAKERRSRQLDTLSDVGNVDIMLGSYSREDEENNVSENEVNLDSGSSRPQQSSNVMGEDFGSLLNTNSRENSEITIETSRLTSEEISNQMSRKLNEIKTGLRLVGLSVHGFSRWLILLGKLRCLRRAELNVLALCCYSTVAVRGIGSL